MRNFKCEWDSLFFETITSLATKKEMLGDTPVTIREDSIFIWDHRLALGTRSLIDNILI